VHDGTATLITSVTVGAAIIFAARVPAQEAHVGVPAAAAHDAGQPPEPPALGAALRARGLQYGYNLDYPEALNTFDQAIAADPADPAACWLAAATVWITVLFQQGSITVDDYLGQARARFVRPPVDPALDASFRAYIHRALVLGGERLRDHPADADAHFQAGAGFGFLASYTATVEGRLLGSFGAARRAYHEHARALALAPARKDAGLTVGLYDYALSGFPAPLRLLAHLAGFGGDRDRAIRLVEDAASYPGDLQPDALFTLILIYNREARYDDALRVIADLQRRFPRNRLLWLEAGNTNLRAGRFADAKAALEDGLTRLAHDPRPHAPGEEGRWRYAHGAALARLRDVQPAERELRLALAGAQRDWLKGRIHNELGTLADLSGDHEAALDHYRAADDLCARDDDAECRQEVKTRLGKAGR